MRILVDADGCPVVDSTIALAKAHKIECLLLCDSSTSGLLWAKQIIERLGVFQADTLDAWYAYFTTGKPEYFYALMQTLLSSNSAPQ